MRPWASWGSGLCCHSLLWTHGERAPTAGWCSWFQLPPVRPNGWLLRSPNCVRKLRETPWFYNRYHFFAGNLSFCFILLLEAVGERRRQESLIWGPEISLTFCHWKEFRKTRDVCWRDHGKCHITVLSSNQHSHGGLVVKTTLPLQGAWVWSLVGELRSHMLHGMVKKKKEDCWSYKGIISPIICPL